MNYIKNILTAVCLCGAAFCALTSCSDDPDEENYYTFTGEMVSDYLSNRPEQFSQFVAILQRSGIYGMMSTYGTYTCFAPTNQAIDNYLRERNIGSVDEMTKAECDTISWNHIIKQAYFTTDLAMDNIPTSNMNGRKILFECRNVAENDNNVVYLLNKTSRIICRDDSVENGVVHTIDRVIEPNSDYLPDRIKQNPELSIFYQALVLTHLNDSLYDYIDPTYYASPDSVVNGFQIKRGGESFHCTLIGERKKGFSAFIETNEVYRNNGINDIEDLKAYAKQVYDEVYPGDAGKYDTDWTNRRNPLNRFVAYHLLPYNGNYLDWTVCDMDGVNLKSNCADTELIDCTDWYTTLMPGTIMKMSTPTGAKAGLYINRRGLKSAAKVPGVRVQPTSEQGDFDPNAVNGIVYYIDDILTYNKTTRDVVFNDRIRINAVTLSPEFINCGARGKRECTAFKVIDGWDFHDIRPNVNLRNRAEHNQTYADCVDFIGRFDISFRMPPVPAGTYEVRFAYGAHQTRGVVQVYFGEKGDVKPVGIPIDFRVDGTDPTIGYVSDTKNADVDAAIDKAMHNRGYMKDMDSWKQGGSDASRLRSFPAKLRKVLCTQTLSPEKEYWVRIRCVLPKEKNNAKDDAELPINYFELCPKSVYAGLTAEDTH